MENAFLSFPILISALIIFSDEYSFILIVLCFLQLNTSQRDANYSFFLSCYFYELSKLLVLKIPLTQLYIRHNEVVENN